MDKPAPHAYIADQLQFARHNFDNLQALIRVSDTKAAAMITLMVFLGASGLQISKDAVGAVQFNSLYKSVFAASTLFILSHYLFPPSSGAYGRFMRCSAHAELDTIRRA